MNLNSFYGLYLTVGIGLPFYILMKLRGEALRLKARKEMISKMPIEQRQIEVAKIHYELSSFKVNHVLHFFISIFTASLWAFLVWLPVTIINKANRSKLEKLLEGI